MELFLLILKIILIALLALIGLILLAFCIILFVPVRYEVSGDIGDSWTFRIKGKASYLLSAVKVLFSYEEERFNWKLFLFGFEKKNEEDKAVTEEESDEDDDAEITFREKEPHVTSMQEDVVSHEVAKQNVERDIATQIFPEDATEADPVKPEREEKNGKKVSKKPNATEEKSKSKFDFTFIKQELTDEHNKSVVHKIWSELCYLFKHFKFRKIKTDLVFATGDPATTGQALGILCMIPMLYRYEFKVVPDFEADEPYVKGTFLVAGKVRLIHVFMTVLRLIFDKEVRIVVKKFIKVLEQ